MVCDSGSFTHRGVQGGRKMRLWDEEEKTENVALRFAREKIKFVRLTYPLFNNMRLNHTLLLFAVCFLFAGCKTDKTLLRIKSMEIEYPARAEYSESWSFRYDSKGRPAHIEFTTDNAGLKRSSSWRCSYSSKELKASSEYSMGNWKRAGDITFQDDFSHITSYILPVQTKENSETGLVFLGQNWVGAYSEGRLVSAMFSDLTSDGTEINKLSWDENGLLEKYEGSDPSVFEEIKDIEYTETPNPFVGPDPVAYLLGITPYFWQGLAGPRPAELVSSFTRVISDPWVEDVSIDAVGISYETDLEGRISHILQTVNNKLETVVTITY